MSIARQFADAPAVTPKVVNAAHVVNQPASEPKPTQPELVSKRQPGSKRSSLEALRTYHKLDMRKRRAKTKADQVALAKPDGPKLARLMTDAEADAEIERQRRAEMGRKSADFDSPTLPRQPTRWRCARYTHTRRSFCLAADSQPYAQNRRPLGGNQDGAGALILVAENGGDDADVHYHRPLAVAEVTR